MNRALLAATLAAALLCLPGAAPARSPAIDGSWRSTHGLMALQETDMRVTGRYTEPAGVFEGQLRGRQVTGYWRQANSPRRCHRKLNGTFYWGRMTLTFTSAGRFTGRWSYCDRPTVPGDGGVSGERAAA